MVSSRIFGTDGQLGKPEYRNWLAVGHAFTTELCQGLRPFITREMETLYRNVSARTAGRPCTCVHVPRRRPNEYHDIATCAWANILEGHHHRNKPNWKQSDSAKWMDPILGPWEMAKLFLPDLGGHADIKSADDMDITGILNLMYWCNNFTIPQHLIKEVRETRNNKWVHVPKLELSDADKTDAFDAIENLLKDPQLALDPDAQRALKEITNLKSVTDLHSMEAWVLADFKKVITTELSNINTDLTALKEEAVRNEQQQSQLKHLQEAMVKQLNDQNQQRKHDLAVLKDDLAALKKEGDRNKMQQSQRKQEQEAMVKQLDDLNQKIGPFLAVFKKDWAASKIEAVRNKMQRPQFKQEQEATVKQLDDLNQQRKHMGNTSWLYFCFLVRSLTVTIKGIRKGHVVAWLILSLLCCSFVILDDSSDKGGK